MDKKRVLRWVGGILVEGGLLAAGVPWWALVAVGALFLLWAEVNQPWFSQRFPGWNPARWRLTAPAELKMAWLIGEARGVDWDESLAVMGRKVAGMMAGVNLGERLVVAYVRVTSKSPEIVSMTAEALVLIGGKERLGKYEPPENGAAVGYLRHPLRLAHGETDSGRMAFGVKAKRGSAIEKCTIRFTDHMQDPPRTELDR